MLIPRRMHIVWRDGKPDHDGAYYTLSLGWADRVLKEPETIWWIRTLPYTVEGGWNTKRNQDGSINYGKEVPEDYVVGWSETAIREEIK